LHFTIYLLAKTNDPASDVGVNMEKILESRWKRFAVRFAVYFPIFLASRLLFGAGILRWIIAYFIARWIDPVRRAQAKAKQSNLKEIFS
jgi:hypothetical protein